jgi:hypothetical protein
MSCTTTKVGKQFGRLKNLKFQKNSEFGVEY